MGAIPTIKNETGSVTPIIGGEGFIVKTSVWKREPYSLGQKRYELKIAAKADDANIIEITAYKVKLTAFNRFLSYLANESIFSRFFTEKDFSTREKFSTSEKIVEKSSEKVSNAFHERFRSEIADPLLTNVVRAETDTQLVDETTQLVNETLARISGVALEQISSSSPETAERLVPRRTTPVQPDTTPTTTVAKDALESKRTSTNSEIVGSEKETKERQAASSTDETIKNKRDSESQQAERHELDAMFTPGSYDDPNKARENSLTQNNGAGVIPPRSDSVFDFVGPPTPPPIAPTVAHEPTVSPTRTTDQETKRTEDEDKASLNARRAAFRARIETFRNWVHENASQLPTETPTPPVKEGVSELVEEDILKPPVAGLSIDTSDESLNEAEEPAPTTVKRTFTTTPKVPKSTPRKDLTDTETKRSITPPAEAAETVVAKETPLRVGAPPRGAWTQGKLIDALRKEKDRDYEDLGLEDLFKTESAAVEPSEVKRTQKSEETPVEDLGIGKVKVAEEQAEAKWETPKRPVLRSSIAEKSPAEFADAASDAFRAATDASFTLSDSFAKRFLQATYVIEKGSFKEANALVEAEKSVLAEGFVKTPERLLKRLTQDLNALEKENSHLLFVGENTAETKPLSDLIKIVEEQIRRIKDIGEREASAEKAVRDREAELRQLREAKGQVGRKVELAELKGRKLVSERKDEREVLRKKAVRDREAELRQLREAKGQVGRKVELAELKRTGLVSERKEELAGNRRTEVKSGDTQVASTSSQPAQVKMKRKAPNPEATREVTTLGKIIRLIGGALITSFAIKQLVKEGPNAGAVVSRSLPGSHNVVNYQENWNAPRGGTSQLGETQLPFADIVGETPSFGDHAQNIASEVTDLASEAFDSVANTATAFARSAADDLDTAYWTGYTVVAVGRELIQQGVAAAAPYVATAGEEIGSRARDLGQTLSEGEAALRQDAGELLGAAGEQASHLGDAVQPRLQQANDIARSYLERAKRVASEYDAQAAGAAIASMILLGTAISLPGNRRKQRVQEEALPSNSDSTQDKGVERSANENREESIQVQRQLRDAIVFQNIRRKNENLNLKKDNPDLANLLEQGVVCLEDNDTSILKMREVCEKLQNAMDREDQPNFEATRDSIYRVLINTRKKIIEKDGDSYNPRARELILRVNDLLTDSKDRDAQSLKEIAKAKQDINNLLENQLESLVNTNLRDAVENHRNIIEVLGFYKAFLEEEPKEPVPGTVTVESQTNTETKRTGVSEPSVSNDVSAEKTVDLAATSSNESNEGEEDPLIALEKAIEDPTLFEDFPNTSKALKTTIKELRNSRGLLNKKMRAQARIRLGKIKDALQRLLERNKAVEDIDEMKIVKDVIAQLEQEIKDSKNRRIG